MLRLGDDVNLSDAYVYSPAPESSFEPTEWLKLAPWLGDQGFLRSVKERSVYCHPDRGLLILLYVDDDVAKGEPEQTVRFFKLLEKHYECKKADHGHVEENSNTPQDYLRITVSEFPKHSDCMVR